MYGSASAWGCNSPGRLTQKLITALRAFLRFLHFLGAARDDLDPRDTSRGPLAARPTPALFVGRGSRPVDRRL